LWFDEYYDEQLYRFESSLKAASEATLLLVVGTSGSTNLPMQMGYLMARRKASLVDVNPGITPFTRLAETTARGFFVQGRATKKLPEIVDHLIIEKPQSPKERRVSS
jgi:NAD-dependent deacetylase